MVEIAEMIRKEGHVRVGDSRPVGTTRRNLLIIVEYGNGIRHVYLRSGFTEFCQNDPIPLTTRPCGTLHRRAVVPGCSFCRVTEAVAYRLVRRYPAIGNRRVTPWRLGDLNHPAHKSLWALSTAMQACYRVTEGTEGMSI